MSLLLVFDGAAPQPRLLILRGRRDAKLDNISCVAVVKVSLTPELSKGLEFDLVVLVDPEAFGTGIEGAVDRYVAMTRATQQLVIRSPPKHP
jgi:superfamily I DNA/RNA helicase